MPTLLSQHAGQRVAQREVLQTKVTAVLDIHVAAHPVLRVAQSWHCVACALACPALEHPSGIVARGNVLAIGGVEHVNTAHALEEDAEVETFPLGVEGETEGPGRYAVADVGTVVGGDGAVAVDIHETQVARLELCAVS